MDAKVLHAFITVVALVSLTACGGSGGSESGILIEGTLTEAGGANHVRSLNLKHEIGERIDGVSVCALDECSVTDQQGAWGFVVSEDFTGGELLFTIDGHGVSDTTVVVIPQGTSEVLIDFQHVEGGAVEAHDLLIDGVPHHSDEHQHDVEEEEHSHEEHSDEE